MKRKGHQQGTFKPYSQAQTMLPTSLDELIAEDHLVRAVNRVIDGLELMPLLRQYKGGGTSSYHPRMMLKVLVYAYTQRIYSSRQIPKALRENVNFMWLSGGNRPDFRTLNGFRGDRMKGVIGEVFAEVLEFLIAEGCEGPSSPSSQSSTPARCVNIDFDQPLVAGKTLRLVNCGYCQNRVSQAWPEQQSTATST